MKHASMKRLFSYDIFDTLITRTTAMPEGIFAIVERRLKEENSRIALKLQNGFFRLRVDAENQARFFLCNGEKEDVSLFEIYSIMQTMAPLTNDDISILIDMELEAEKGNSVAIAENIKRIVRHKENGDRVILISDMYLSSEHIREILLIHDDVFSDIPIYVSSETGRIKGNTELWRMIRSEELVLWENWIHTGDNLYGDVKIPRSLGIKAKRYHCEPLLSCEKHILISHKTDPDLQMFVGASRNTRRHLGSNAPIKLGSTYGTAILLAYILWVLNICTNKGIKDLYFVARDGRLLLDIAMIINKYKNLGINMKYIYGSRRAWRSIEYLQGDVWDRDYYHLKRNELVLLKSYFRQEINLDAQEIGFVEVHGNGDTQDCIGRILSSMTDIQISSFYITLDRHIKSDVNFYRFMEVKPEFSNIMEILTRALHGKTIGYKKEEKIIPVLENDENIILQKYGYENYMKAVEETVRGYADCLKANNRDLDCFMYSSDFLSCLLTKERGSVFEYICDIPITNTVEGKEKIMTFAPRITQSMIDEVREKGYFGYDGWCLPFSLRRLSCKQRHQIDMNKSHYLEAEKKKADQLIEKKRIEKKNQQIRYVVNRNALKPRIVLYGAGTVGKSLFNYITENNLAKIVVWIDRTITKRDGIYDRRDHIGNYEYDMVLIAIKRPDLDELKVDLMALGCKPEKIYWEDYQAIDSTRGGGNVFK